MGVVEKFFYRDCVENSTINIFSEQSSPVALDRSVNECCRAHEFLIDPSLSTLGTQVSGDRSGQHAAARYSETDSRTIFFCKPR
jgi:hypothetical protein